MLASSQLILHPVLSSFFLPLPQKSTPIISHSTIGAVAGAIIGEDTIGRKHGAGRQDSPSCIIFLVGRSSKIQISYRKEIGGEGVLIFFWLWVDRDMFVPRYRAVTENAGRASAHIIRAFLRARTTRAHTNSADPPIRAPRSPCRNFSPLYDYHDFFPPPPNLNHTDHSRGMYRLPAH